MAARQPSQPPASAPKSYASLRQTRRKKRRRKRMEEKQRKTRKSVQRRLKRKILFLWGVVAVVMMRSTTEKFALVTSSKRQSIADISFIKT
jgi:hypothetical protein